MGVETPIPSEYAYGSGVVGGDKVGVSKEEGARNPSWLLLEELLKDKVEDEVDCDGDI